MASKASTPEVESRRQMERVEGDKLETDFENLDSQAEDLQPSEEDPSYPLNYSMRMEASRSTSRSSIDKKYLDRDEKILGHDNNVDYPMPNSKTPKTKLSFINKIGRNGGRKKLDLSHSNFEKKIRKKFGLTHYGFVVGIVLLAATILAFLVIIVFGITWPRTPHGRSFPICTKTACLKASSMVLPKLDKSKSPCSDAYGFLCGDWSKEHSKPPPTRVRWGPEEEMDLKLAEMTRGVISTMPHPSNVGNLSWKIKNLYDSCMSLDSIERDKERPLEKIIMDLGGWDVLRKFTVMSWDFGDALTRLHAEHGVEPFFSVSVVSDPRNSTRNIVKISPAGLGLPHTSYYYRQKDDRISSSYRRYMKDVALVLGAVSKDANTFSEDMFYFERRIVEITPPVEELEDVRKHEIHTITSLKIIAPSIPFYSLLDATLRKANINENTEILVTSSFYLSKISTIIATIDRGALNNYFVWSLVKQYIPYLSQSFTDIHFLYMREMAGLAEPMERWEFCVRTLRRFMNLALTVQLDKRVPASVRRENKRVAEEVFESIRTAVRESVTKSDWIDLDLHKHIISKLDGLKLHIGYPSDYMDTAYLEEYYQKLHVQKNDFFRNMQSGVTFLQEEMGRRYLHPKEEYKWLNQMSSETKVSFVPSANAVIIPQRLLSEPYFNPDYPTAMLYGTLGVDIAREIVSSIIKYSVLYNSNGTLLKGDSLLANLSLTSTDKQVKCLSDFVSSCNVSDATPTDRTSLNTFISISAVRQALKALKKSTANSEHVHQAGLEEFENENLFFITFGQSLCSVMTTQQVDIDNTMHNSLGSRQLIKTIGLQLKSFAEAFNCRTPSDHCKDILAGLFLRFRTLKKLTLSLAERMLISRCTPVLPHMKLATGVHVICGACLKTLFIPVEKTLHVDDAELREHVETCRESEQIIQLTAMYSEHMIAMDSSLTTMNAQTQQKRRLFSITEFAKDMNGQQRLASRLQSRKPSMSTKFTIDKPTATVLKELTDKYTKDIMTKSTALTSSYGEIMVHPSRCIMAKAFEKNIDRVRNLQVFPDDTWVVTFPKCGTTWTQEMVWLLKNNLDFEKAKASKLSDRVPFFESETILSKIPEGKEWDYHSIQMTENLSRPRCIKSHLPMELLPKQLWTVKPKIIYVARDPRDVAISYYHHHRLWIGYQGTLEEFVDVFLNDRVVYSPYWGHVLGFLDLKDRSHLLMNTYEEMKKDLGKVIRKTAQFLNVELTEDQVKQLEEHLSFKNMKANESVNGKDMEISVKKETKADENDENLTFIRKGETGGWKNIFGNEILEKFQKWNDQYLSGRDFNEYPWA